MNRDRIIIIVLAIAIVGLVIYFAVLPAISNFYYQQGVNDALVAIANQVTTTGQVPTIVNGTIQWVQLEVGS